MDELKAGRRPRGRRRRGGLTLIEVMIAMGILSFGLLALLALQVEAMQGGRSSRHSTEASRIARDRMETFQRLAWDDPALDDTGGWTDPVTVTNTVTMPNGSTATEETYELQWRITDDASNPDLRSIDVRVTWDDGTSRGDGGRIAMSSIRHNDPEL